MNFTRSASRTQIYGGAIKQGKAHCSPLPNDYMVVCCASSAAAVCAVAFASLLLRHFAPIIQATTTSATISKKHSKYDKNEFTNKIKFVICPNLLSS